MHSKYVYKGIDITLDVYEKITSVVELIAERNGISFDDAFAQFVGSEAYGILADPRTLMWSESAPFICNEYEAEANADKCLG